MKKENDRIKKVLHRIVSVMLTVLLIFNLTALLLQFRTGTDFLRNTPVALLQVSGGSMEPVLHAGDAVLVRQEPFSAVTEGDIIVFCRRDELIVHKVIEVGEGSVVTQGTANAVPDAPVREEEYRARLICRIPALGVIWKFCSSAPLFLLWTLLLVLLLFGTDIFPALYEHLQKRKNH